MTRRSLALERTPGRSFHPLALSAALLLLGTGSASSAPPSDATVLKGGIRSAVQVTAMDLDVVATKGGQNVRDLKKEEFVVKVDGKVLPIDYFVRVTAGTVHGPDLATASPDLVLDTLRNDAGDRYVPRQFLVLFDDERLLPFERARVIEGLRDFFTRLSPSDRVSIVSYNTSARVFVPYTNSVETLLDALTKLQKIAPRGLTWESQYRSEIADIRRSRAYSRDAMIRNWAQQISNAEKGFLEEFRRSVAALAARSGKRTLIYISNGLELHPGQTLRQSFGTGLVSQWEYSVTPEFERVIAEANRSGVTVHALDAKGLTVDVDASESAAPAINDFFARQNLRESLASLAEQTGGRLVENKNTFGADLDRIYKESSSYYSVGVTLGNLDPKKTEFKVEVATTRPGVTVRTRRGFGPKGADEAARDRVEMALMTPDAAGDFPAGLKIGDAKKVGGLSTKRLAPYQIAVPMSQLTFLDKEGAKTATVEFSLAAVEDDGSRSGVQAVRKTITVPAAEWEKAKGQAFVFSGELKSGKGNIRFVATVRDVATGRMAIASAPTRIE